MQEKLLPQDQKENKASVIDSFNYAANNNNSNKQLNLDNYQYNNNTVSAS